MSSARNETRMAARSCSVFVTVAAVAALLVTVAPVVAHHSAAAAYDESKRVEINLGPQSSLHLQPGRLYLLPEILAP